MTLTPWFPAKVKPVRVGWYEVKGCIGFMDCGGMHYWDGKDWRYSWGRGAVLLTFTALPWRGIKK